MNTHTVISTIEHLVEVAHRAQSKEAEFYKQALVEIRRNEDSDNLGDLLVQLFGSPEARRVATAVQSWHKLRKGEHVGAEKAKTPASRATSPVPHYVPAPYPYPPPPTYAYPPAPAPGVGHSGAYGSRRGTYGSSRGGRSYFRFRGKCFSCGEFGHRVSDCLALKKDRLTKDRP